MNNHDPTNETTATDTQVFSSAVVLVVDDEPSICWGFRRMLDDEGHEVLIASSAEEGLQLAKQRQPSLILLDVRLPGEDGITALPKFIEATENASIVVMTAFGDLETAVAAVSNGASDYLTKPFSLEDAGRTCRVCLDAARSRIIPTTPSTARKGSVRLVGSSPAMQHAFRQIALVAGSDLSVLITGETGTGKELVAAAIHRHSNRKEKPYLPIAPIAFNPELIESELFGHVKGAFTGASDDRAGLFAQAEGGTVLLDEIGELPLSIQAKLLRVLEQREYCRVGDVTPRKCDVRIIASTNCDLNQAVRDKRFREDLYYRLNGLHIHLPPLRQRTEDIPELCRYFLDCMSYRSSTELTDSFIESLVSRPLQGNVRELKNAVQHAAVVARGRPLTGDDLPKAQPYAKSLEQPYGETGLRQSLQEWVNQQLKNNPNEESKLYSRLLSVIEPVLIQLTLDETSGNRAKASELLGLHRSTLREKIRVYKIDENDA